MSRTRQTDRQMDGRTSCLQGPGSCPVLASAQEERHLCVTPSSASPEAATGQASIRLISSWSSFALSLCCSGRWLPSRDLILAHTLDSVTGTRVASIEAFESAPTFRQRPRLLSGDFGVCELCLFWKLEF